MAAKSKNIEHADVVTETQQNSIASQFVHTYIEMEHSECLCAIASSYAWCWGMEKHCRVLAGSMMKS